MKHVFHRKITRYISTRDKKKSLFICYTITVAGLRVLEVVAIFLTSS